jgi:LysM repeat protein
MSYQTYTVRGGDSLSKIAQRLGISNWRDLYNLNKSLIGANPNYIRPGQVLNIPGTQAAQPAPAPAQPAPAPATPAPASAGATAGQSAAPKRVARFCY